MGSNLFLKWCRRLNRRSVDPYQQPWQNRQRRRGPPMFRGRRVVEVEIEKATWKSRRQRGRSASDRAASSVAEKSASDPVSISDCTANGVSIYCAPVRDWSMAAPATTAAAAGVQSTDTAAAATRHEPRRRWLQCRRKRRGYPLRARL